MNLIGNARDALRSRPAPRRVTVRSSIAPGGEALLEIRDNGGGIPPEIRSRIFDPFFTTKPMGEGTGLGLSLCHGIISAHDGTIAVSSEVNSGTSFVITLPPGPEESEEDDVSANVASPMASLRILVVDDNPDVANSFAEILTIQGHSVEIAATGTEALRLIEEGEYAIVLTDMRMPDVDGPSLYRQVSARDSLLAKSFLFVTGDTFSEATHRFLTETSAVYLSKPCTFAEVESAVAQVLRRRAG
jgi:CheY-like chemotaxis protein